MFAYLQQQKQYLPAFFFVAFLLLLLAPSLQAQSLDTSPTQSPWSLATHATQSQRVFLPLAQQADALTMNITNIAPPSATLGGAEPLSDPTGARGNLLATQTPTRIPTLRPTNTPTQVATPIVTVTAPPSPTPVVIVPVFPTPTQHFTFTWEVRVSFSATQTTGIIAHWVMKRTEAGGASQVVEKVEISDQCTRVGNVAVVGTQGIFSGGYVACSLPDFQERVFAYTKQWKECLCSFHQVTPPWVAARFTIRGANKIHPLAYLDNDLRFSVHSDLSSGYTQLTFASGGVIESQHPPLYQQDTIAFTGYNPRTIFPTLELASGGAHAFLNQPHLLAAANQTAPASFLAWRSTSLHNTIPAPGANPTLNPTWLYIGGSPTTTDRLHGVIEQVFIDPGCVSG